jgi:diguanylate cyclase (GGDEF)-like protein
VDRFRKSEDDTTVTKRTETVARAPGGLQPCLLVLTGSAVGRSFRLTNAGYVIGRGSEVDIRLDDDGVSRQHAKIVLLPKGVVLIKDLGSTNGTYVNSEQVEAHPLQDGDRIRIGATTCLQFTLEDDIEANLRDHLYSAATRDALTKIPNRRVFEEQLDRSTAYAKRHKQPLSVVMFDIDHFKRINDEHGHLTGDDVLRQVAALLASAIRAEDTLARLGGEEFGLIVDGNDLAQAVSTAERLRAAVAERPILTRSGGVPVTLSVGVAEFDPSVHKAPLELVAAADARLYEAKRTGRNRVCPRV